MNAPAVNGLAERARATSAGSWWPPTGALATATLVAAYASTAYRLESVSAQARTVVSWAEQQLGKPYQWAAAGPGSFDCSGLAMAALAQAGIAVTHNANAQWQQTKAHPVTENQLAAGDLVFYAGSDGSLTAPGHVGIYIGNGEVIDAPYAGANVRFDPLTTISGYAGATDPYAATSTAGTTAPIPVGNPAIPLAAPAAPLAPPTALNQYQSYAQTLARNISTIRPIPAWKKSRSPPRRGSRPASMSRLSVTRNVSASDQANSTSASVPVRHQRDAAPGAALDCLKEPGLSGKAP